MKKKTLGRPRKAVSRLRKQLLQIRVECSEKVGFANAAELRGLDVSTWARQHLRDEARRTLEGFGRKVPFVR
jgi:hypothetical protein